MQTPTNQMRITIKIPAQEIVADTWEQVAQISNALRSLCLTAEAIATIGQTPVSVTVQVPCDTEIDLLTMQAPDEKPSIVELERGIEYPELPSRIAEPRYGQVYVGGGWRDIGEWHDDHPLNKRATADTEYQRLFMPNVKGEAQPPAK